MEMKMGEVFFIPDKYGNVNHAVMSYETYRNLMEKDSPGFHEMTVSELNTFIANLRNFFTQHQVMFRLLIGAEEFGKTFESMAHTEEDNEDHD